MGYLSRNKYKLITALLLTFILPIGITLLANLASNGNLSSTFNAFSDISIDWSTIFFVVNFIIIYGTIVLYSILFHQLHISYAKKNTKRKFLLWSVIIFITLIIIFIVFFLYSLAYSFFGLSLTNFPLPTISP
jgi:hypothetical protein